MAVTFMAGFETQSGDLEGSGGALQGTASSFSALQVRTGATSLRCNPTSGNTGYISLGVTPDAGFVHFGLYVAALPTVSRFIWNTTNGGQIALKLTSAGTIEIYIGTTLIGTSTTALQTGRWYWIGYRSLTGTSVVFLQIDSRDEVTGTATVSAGNILNNVGCASGDLSAIDIYIDDVVVDGAGFLLPSRVALLVPTADSAKGTGWTNDAAATTNLFDAVNNEPPVGIADTTGSTGLHQIRNATSNANSNYDATMTTYSAAGIGPNDAVLAVMPIVSTAAPVTTSAKQGTVGMASNPTIANVALSAISGTAGAFWAGAAGGAYPIGWKMSQGTVATSPTVTLGTAPVMRITQVTSSTRIAVVCFMGIYVAWTPGALGVIGEPGVFPGRGPRNVSQGINRAASY